MTKSEIKTILSIIPKTGDPDIDDNIEKAINAISKQPEIPNHVESHSEKDILTICIDMMQELTESFISWYDREHDEGSYDHLDEGDKFYEYSDYARLVSRLFLSNTHHSGRSATIMKCAELGVDFTDRIVFKHRSID